ncbi:hypothetical protein V8C37DRAFT_396065, partial [Trichoderma ceciliae]
MRKSYGAKTEPYHDSETESRHTSLRLEMPYRPEIPLATKDCVINEIEDHLEIKYLRHCDLPNLLHTCTFTSIMMRSAVRKTRLFAHNRRQFVHRHSKASQKDHNIALFNAMKLLEYTNMIQEGRMGLDKYMWQIGTSYCGEFRSRTTGPDVDKAWLLIGYSICQILMKMYIVRRMR